MYGAYILVTTTGGIGEAATPVVSKWAGSRGRAYAGGFRTEPLGENFDYALCIFME